jgi:hypothetical protein
MQTSLKATAFVVVFAGLAVAERALERSAGAQRRAPSFSGRSNLAQDAAAVDARAGRGTRARVRAITCGSSIGRGRLRTMRLPRIPQRRAVTRRLARFW